MLFPEDSYEARVQRWMGHSGTPPFMPDPAYDEAQRRKFGGANPLQGILKQLMGGAGPRGATFAGRVIPQGQTPDLKELMTQLPTDIPEEGYGVLPSLDASYFRALKGGLGGGEVSVQDVLRRNLTSSTQASRHFEEQKRRNAR